MLTKKSALVADFFFACACLPPGYSGGMSPMLAGAQRILILGSPGAGKSTLARQLARSMALPLVHLDALYWAQGTPPAAGKASVPMACQPPRCRVGAGALCSVYGTTPVFSAHGIWRCFLLLRARCCGSQGLPLCSNACTKLNTYKLIAASACWVSVRATFYT